ncbi:hypothetical protein ES319_D01G049200v1 [Gossypium barbadense]|uniref:folate gamma-glutamyl hydrolase n=1 Tax=Gossypium barbadense TaxID=3634 RepID=A0A5J5SKE5_GOSBA|nr:hypothetical protein ES319_D01G049200v1 [Gossypium barbadense]
MPSLFGSNPSSSDPANDTVPSPSSSCSSSSSPDMWNYFFIPILLHLTKKLSLAKAQTSTGLLLPSQRGDGSADDSLISFSRCANADPKLYYRPVIGILSHPVGGASGGRSYIVASYVKFVEAAGGRVIPLIYNEPEEILFQKLELVNGVLLPGGRSKSGLYYDIAEKIFKKVIEKNDRGDHFPLYAICLGFELLTMIISEDKKILERFSALNRASSLQFVENVNIEGTVFQRFPPNLLQKLGTDRLVMQNHCWGISPEKLQNTPNLSRFFKILTTSTDKNNKVYVSTAQAHRYPVTAFQWHPEKNAFESGLSMIPHSDDAIEVTQHVANFFIREARRSLNRPAAQKVRDSLIYNYRPKYYGKAGKGFDQVYIFTQRQARN